LKESLNVYAFIDLITDYQESVERVIAAFKQAFNRTDFLTACRSDKIFPQVGELKNSNIKTNSISALCACTFRVLFAESNVIHSLKA
jgi:hypothetical protein